MARQATGAIIEHRGKDGRTYRRLRFSAYGERRLVSLGAVTARKAEAELRHVLADVERGTWQPPQAVESPEQPSVPTFHQYAESWWLRVEKQLAAKTKEDYRWRLEKHLIGYFGELPLDRITVATVEDYIAAKLAGTVYDTGVPIGEDDPLSHRSINMTVTLLGAILESALDRELIGRNPARGRGRRVRERTPGRSYLETASQISALLDAAGELDGEAAENRKHVERRAIVATLIFTGLRIGELCALRWRDVDLPAGWLTVGGSKTDAGRRRVKIRGALRDELADVRARRGSAPADGFVFATRSNGQQDTHNVRSRVVAAAVKRANDDLEDRGLPPLPEGITPHSLRRTFCSLLYALGEAPPVVMQEMGHTDPSLALKVYAQVMRRGEDEQAQLRALVEGGQLAFIGIRPAAVPAGEDRRDAA